MNVCISCECVDKMIEIKYNIIVNTSLICEKSCSVFGHSKIEITENLKERLPRLIADTHEIIEFLGENRWLTDAHKKFISAIKKELTKLS